MTEKQQSTAIILAVIISALVTLLMVSHQLGKYLNTLTCEDLGCVECRDGGPESPHDEDSYEYKETSA